MLLLPKTTNKEGGAPVTICFVSLPHTTDDCCWMLIEDFPRYCTIVQLICCTASVQVLKVILATGLKSLAKDTYVSTAGLLIYVRAVSWSFHQWWRSCLFSKSLFIHILYVCWSCDSMLVGGLSLYVVVFFCHAAMNASFCSLSQHL